MLPSTPKSPRSRVGETTTMEWTQGAEEWADLRVDGRSERETGGVCGRDAEEWR